MPLPDFDWRPSAAISVGDGRARLRPWGLDEASALAAAWADDDVGLWNSVPERRDAVDANRYLRQAEARARAVRPSFDLALECAGIQPDRSPVGELGLFDIATPRRAAQIGYWLLPSARGRGLATDSILALVTWALSQSRYQLIVGRCNPQNVSSRRVLQRCDFKFGGHDRSGYELWALRATLPPE